MLTEAEIEAFTRDFERDGCVVMRGVFDPAIAEQARTDYRGTATGPLCSPWPPGLVKLIDELAGTDSWSVELPRMRFRLPEPDEPECVDWHRNSVAAGCFAIVFVLFQRAKVENGAMRLLIGSHPDGRVLDLSREVRYMTGDAGDVWLIDKDLWHSKSRNRTAVKFGDPRIMGVADICAQDPPRMTTRSGPP